MQGILLPLKIGGNIQLAASKSMKEMLLQTLVPRMLQNAHSSCKRCPAKLILSRKKRSGRGIPILKRGSTLPLTIEFRIFNFRMASIWGEEHEKTHCH